MPQAFVKTAPRTLEGWRALWQFTDDAFVRRRRRTREVRVGEVGIGAANPIRVQSMTIADTMDTVAVVDEIEALAAAGSEIVRVTTPNRSAAANLRDIHAALRRRRVHVPLVADVHFTPQAALIAAEYAEKVRINPGNYADRKHFQKREYSDSEYAGELERLAAAFRPLVLRCKELGVAMRIGTNHGSLSDRILNRYGDTPAGMVESALEFVRICEADGYRDIVLSMKASDVKVMIEAYRLLARRQRELGMDYPLHLGVTEAGSGLAARVKSAIGIVTLLDDGLGDTIRVSLTEDSIHELPVARALAALPQAPELGEGAAAAVAGAADATRAAAHAVPRWDPCAFERRRVRPLGGGTTRLATDQPPRIEIVLRSTSADLAHDLHALHALESAHDVDLILVALEHADASAGMAELGRILESRRALNGAAYGVELDLAAFSDPALHDLTTRATWARLSLHLGVGDLPCVLAADSVARQRLHEVTAPLQYTLRVRGLPQAADVRALAQALANDTLPAGALALDLEPACDAAHTWRAWLAAWPPHAPAVPVVLRGPTSEADADVVDAFTTTAELRVAAGLGAVLADGIGESVQLPAARPGDAGALAREILQATRMRLSQADFIACPSCGRTQVDLQSTTALIQRHLRHLKGLKIAVMGCIVNGPGEMADADFGYVGSGPGRIDLYVGHERVERDVLQSEAVGRLIDLIQRNGRWTEPGT